MIGGNAVASRLTGINSEKMLLKLFMMTSALAALGGCIMSARMSSGQPMSCEGLEFDAVTAAVLGGVAMSGGIGSLSGALIGLFIMQGFNNGLMMLNVPSFWQTVSRGPAADCRTLVRLFAQPPRQAQVSLQMNPIALW